MGGKAMHAQEADMTLDRADPKGLVRESYLIEGIGPEECRSIFVDWALSLAPAVPVPAALRVLIGIYGAAQPRHPMTAILAAGLDAPALPGRRGGRSGRLQRGGEGGGGAGGGVAQADR